MNRLESRKPSSVSVIIPNLNCPILDQALDALYTQSLASRVSVEIIVVGRDEPGCLRCFPEVTFIYTERPVGPARARNIGIQQAQNQLIVCLDADCIPDSNWLSEMLTAHQKYPQYAVVGGSIRIEESNLWALADNLSSFHAYLPTLQPGIYPVLPTCNISIRRETFDRVGLFDESLLINEDADWMMRARREGFSLHFYPSACVWHRPQRRTFRSVLVHARDWGYYSIVNRHRYQDLESLPWVLKRWWSLILSSPLIATAVTVGIFARSPDTWRYLYVSPVILAAKLAWCWGAARRLKSGSSAFS